jgi:hypothetical protein
MATPRMAFLNMRSPFWKPAAMGGMGTGRRPR